MNLTGGNKMKMVVKSTLILELDDKEVKILSMIIDHYKQQTQNSPSQVTPPHYKEFTDNIKQATQAYIQGNRIVAKESMVLGEQK
jgi:hypothetical protein